MRGPGGMISFVLKPAQEAGARAGARHAARDAALRLRRVARRRRVADRASGDHDARVDPAGESRSKLGISDGLMRLSVGIEHVDDLIDDLRQALERADS